MAQSRLQLAASLAVLALAPALGACGGSDDAGSATAATPAAHARYLSASELERDLGNGFRHGLYRLAVMSQPADDAADLGQDLPTGTLTRVRCTAAAAGASCDVRWRTVDGEPRRTRYRVRLLARGCFAAGASPRLPAHRDTTIASFAEHPLNAIVSARKGCP